MNCGMIANRYSFVDHDAIPTCFIENLACRLCRLAPEAFGLLRDYLNFLVNHNIRIQVIAKVCEYCLIL